MSDATPNTHDTPAPLAPCPFCGCDDIAIIEDRGDNYREWRCDCQNDECIGTTTGKLTRDEAVAAWNRRAPAPQPCGHPDTDQQRADDEALCVTLRRERDAALQREPKPSLLANEINALPQRVRDYIMWIETDADPAGTIQSEYSLREQRDGLVVKIREVEVERDEARADAAKLREALDSHAAALALSWSQPDSVSTKRAEVTALIRAMQQTLDGVAPVPAALAATAATPPAAHASTTRLVAALKQLRAAAAPIVGFATPSIDFQPLAAFNAADDEARAAIAECERSATPAAQGAAANASDGARVPASINEALAHILKLPFESRPFVCSVTGEVEWFFEDTPHYSEWVNHNLTLYRERDNERVVGIRVSGKILDPVRVAEPPRAEGEAT